MLRELLLNIGHNIHDKAEDFAAASTCFLILNGVDWSYEVIRFSLGICASVLSGYIVNRLKKYWDKPNKTNNGKKN